MKLVTFDRAGEQKLGVLLGEKVLDVAAQEQAAGQGSDPAYLSMQALIEAGPAALERLRTLVEKADPSTCYGLGEYRLLAPLPRPVQMRDTLCFEKHFSQAMVGMTALRAELQGADPKAAVAAAEKAGALAVPPIFYDQPIYYKANRFAVTGPDQEVVWPAYSQYMGYECELACVIGTGGVDIQAGDALSHIFGFTIFNDLSARDSQARETQGWLGPAKSKDFDNANVLGPCIVTIDEIGDYRTLEMIVRLNGEEVSRGSAGTMHWSFEQAIEWITQSETIHPGEVIGSGTVGDGCGLEHSRFLKSGDLVELEISKIGTLRTRIIRH